ncbi:MAG: hypothetical protein V1827_03665 [Candidatus Micrarchaeota archaeon]
MNRFKLTSYLFLLLWLLVVVGVAYLTISFVTGVISAVVDFVTTNDYTKLQQCGISPPGEFASLKSEFANLLLVLYMGFPGVLLVISALAFVAGFYYYRGKFEDESKKHEVLEREMVHKIVAKMETEKGKPAQKEDMEPEEPPEEEEPSPRFSSLKKKK